MSHIGFNQKVPINAFLRFCGELNFREILLLVHEDSSGNTDDHLVLSILSGFRSVLVLLITLEFFTVESEA